MVLPNECFDGLAESNGTVNIELQDFFEYATQRVSIIDQLTCSYMLTSSIIVPVQSSVELLSRDFLTRLQFALQ